LLWTKPLQIMPDKEIHHNSAAVRHELERLEELWSPAWCP